MTDLSKQGDLSSGSSTGERTSDDEGEQAMSAPNAPQLAIVRGHDEITNPAHYVRLNPQPLDVIEAWSLNYHRGNALKYLARAGYKGDEATDLRKAAAYLLREADRIEARTKEG